MKTDDPITTEWLITLCERMIIFTTIYAKLAKLAGRCKYATTTAV